MEASFDADLVNNPPKSTLAGPLSPFISCLSYTVSYLIKYPPPQKKKAPKNTLNRFGMKIHFYNIQILLGKILPDRSNDKYYEMGKVTQQASSDLPIR